MVKPRCVPGVCFRGDMCVETAQGVECGPCPDGYTGDGFNCDDVDEVRTAACLPKKVMGERMLPRLHTCGPRCSLMGALAEELLCAAAGEH